MLLHLAHETVRLGRHAWQGALQPTVQCLLAEPEFLGERSLQALGLGIGEQDPGEGVQALGQAGVAGLERGGLSDRPGQDANIQPRRVQGREPLRLRPGCVEARSARLARRWADDARVHVGCPGAFDHGTHLQGGLLRDGVAVHVERRRAGGAHRRGHLLCGLHGAGGHQDGQHQLRLAHQALQAAHVLHTGRGGQLPGACAAPVQRGDGAQAVAGQHLGDGLAHVAGAVDGNGLQGRSRRCWWSVGGARGGEAAGSGPPPPCTDGVGTASAPA